MVRYIRGQFITRLLNKAKITRVDKATLIRVSVIREANIVHIDNIVQQL